VKRRWTESRYWVGAIGPATASIVVRQYAALQSDSLTSPVPHVRQIHGGRVPSKALVRLLMVVLCLIWGSTWIVIKGGLRDLPPFTSAGLRFVIAAVVMVGVAALLSRKEGGAAPPTWLWIVQGTASFAISYGLVYHAETVLPSGLVSLLWGVYPMLQALSGQLFLEGERLRPGQWIGFGVALVGLVLLFRTDLQSFGSEGVPTALLLLLSPISVVVGTTLVKKHGGGVSSTLLNRNGMFVAAGVLMAAALTLERGAPVAWTAPAIGSILYLSLVGTVLTFSLFFWLLRFAPAHQLGLIAYVTPVIALFLGWAVGSEPITVFTLGGAALILGGVVLVARRPWSLH
jgi:drug/metabolite transporter (DMT)-like permease